MTAHVSVVHPRFGRAIVDALTREVAGATAQLVDPKTLEAPAFDVADTEVLIGYKFPEALVRSLDALRWIQLTSTGYDHAVDDARTRGARLSHAGDIPCVAVAEFAWMAMLGMAKGAPAMVRQQDQHLWRRPPARRLAGATLLVVGMGRIGREVARRAAGFSMRVVGVRASGEASPHAERVVGPDAIDEVLGEADYVVLALPSTDATRGLFDRPRIERMKPGSFLVNVGRAETLDGRAAATAAVDGRLAGVTLDVHDVEPLPADDPLWSAPGVWVTPHSAHEYPEQEADLAALCVDNVARYLRGEPLRNEITIAKAGSQP